MYGALKYNVGTDTVSKAEQNALGLAIDLANAYGSVPHKLIHIALSFFHVPPHIQSLVTRNFHVCYTTQAIILIGGRQMVSGVRSQSGQRLPALRRFTGDVTTLLQTAACK